MMMLLCCVDDCALAYFPLKFQISFVELIKKGKLICRIQLLFYPSKFLQFSSTRIRARLGQAHLLKRLRKAFAY